MTLSEVLRKLDKDSEVDVTDGLKLNIRCSVCEVPEDLILRGVDFLAPSTIGGLHLRIVLDDPALYY